MAPLPGATTLDVNVILQPSDPSALAAYAAAVSTPGSSSYRQALSEQQFVHRFGPRPDSIAAVTRAMTGSGLHPGPVSANDLSIPVQATAEQLTAAFSTGFKRYRLHGGRLAYANTAAPQVLGSIAPYVQGVVGLDDLNVATPVSRPAPASVGGGVAAPHVATGGPQPCTTAVHDGATDSSTPPTSWRRPTGSPTCTARATSGWARRWRSTSCRGTAPRTSPPTSRATAPRRR